MDQKASLAEITRSVSVVLTGNIYALLIERIQRFRRLHEALRHCDGRSQLRVAKVPYRWALDEPMPRSTQCRIKTNPHEAMILRNRQAAALCHLGKRVADKPRPIFDQRLALARGVGDERENVLLAEHAAHLEAAAPKAGLEPTTETTDADEIILCSRAFDIEHDFIAPERSGREGIVVVGIGRQPQNDDIARS